MKITRSILLLAGLAALTVAGPGAARAEEPGLYVIGMEYLYPDDSPRVFSGFTISGAFADSGSATLLSETANADGSSTQIHRLKGSGGTIQLQMVLGAEYYGGAYHGHRLGTYSVLSGTRAYAGLSGGGEVVLSWTYTGSDLTPGDTIVEFRLDNDPVNAAPTAVLLPGSITKPLTVVLGASSSHDEDGIIVKYEWDLDDDGSFELDTGLSSGTTVTVAATGTYAFGVRVTDNDGATDTEYVTVPVHAPTDVQVTAPAAGGTVSGTSVRLAATATNASFVRFFVDGLVVGTDLTSPYEVTWDSTAWADGNHRIMAQVTGLDARVVWDFIDVTVANGTLPPPPLKVTGIQPNSMPAGSSLTVGVTGSGFAPGMQLAFVNGTGPTPVASYVVTTGLGTLSASVTVKKVGPKGEHVWDVQLTHPDGRTASLVGGFTVVR